jgi:hypothetical protein
MADKKIQLKRNNASTIDNLFPVVRITDAVGSDGTTTFLSSGKIRLTYLPDFITGAGRGFYLVGTISGSVALDGVGGIVQQLAGAVQSGGGYDNAYGYMWVASSTVTLSWTDQTTLNPNRLHVLLPGDEADATSPVTLEAGDQLVFTKYSATAGTGDDEEFTFSVINNTYQNATTGAAGITRLSDRTTVATPTAGTEDHVITNNILLGMMGTTTGKIATGNHLHTDVYEPHNDGLTDLAALLTTGTAGFVRVNGVNDASLDTNSYLNASATSTQAGYFGNIHLQDDTNPSHYLGITTASDLTAARTLSLVTGDANRSITLAGDLNIAGNFSATTAAVTINATAGGSTLGLPTSISFPALATNDVLYASGTNTVGKIASTTIGRNLLQIADLSAVAYARFNADETISMLDAASFRSAIGAGTSSTTGTVTSVATDGLALTGGPITTTGTITHSTADGYKHVPTTSTTNDRKFLVAGSTAGSFAWEAFPRTFYDTTSGTISGDIIFDEVA